MFGVWSSITERIKHSKYVERLCQRFDQETTERKKSGKHFPGKSLLQRSFMAILAISIMAIFITAITQYAYWQQDIEKDPNLWNLTDSGILWDVHYGNSEDCNGVPCQFVSGQKVVDKQMTLPAREFPLLDWQRGQKIYLDTKIKLPKKLLKTDQPIAFYSLYIWAENYRFFLNGKEFHSGGKETVFITIPQSMLQEVNSFAFEIDSGDLPYQGLANRHDLLMGPKDAMASLAHSSHEYLTAYPLWFMIPKLVLCLFFICLFLGLYRYREVSYLVVFLGISAFSDFAKSAYFETWFGIEEAHMLSYMSTLFAQLWFLVFIHEYFRRHSNFFNFASRTALFVVIIAGGLFHLHEPSRVALLRIFFLTEWTHLVDICSYLYGATLALALNLYLTRKNQFTFRRKSSLFLFWLFLGSFSFGVWQVVYPTLERDPQYLTTLLNIFLIFTFAALLLIEFSMSLPTRNAMQKLFTRFMDNRILVDAMKSEELLRPKQRKVISLVVDIRNFTNFVDKNSIGKVTEKLIKFRRIVESEVQNHFGLLDKFLGDGALIHFTYESILRQPAMDAVSAAHQISKTFSEENRTGEKLSLCFGANLGEALVGAIGDDKKAEYTAVGQSVNSAFRIESLTRVLGVDLLVNEELYREVASRCLAVEFKDQKLKGISKSQNIYGILAYRKDNSEWSFINENHRPYFKTNLPLLYSVDEFYECVSHKIRKKQEAEV